MLCDKPTSEHSVSLNHQNFLSEFNKEAFQILGEIFMIQFVPTWSIFVGPPSHKLLSLGKETTIIP